jgi:protein gp37
MSTGIEWTDETWNPTTGCDRVSSGCDNCYALGMAKRLKAMGQPDYQTDGDPKTSGPGFGLAIHPHRLNLPLRWKKPRKVFVNSMSDLFHADVTWAHIAQVFAVMALAPQHTFQILTKRHARLRSLLSMTNAKRDILLSAQAMAEVDDIPWPLPNVWLGVSVEDQQWANIRIPALLDTPAAVRFLSCEPLLGPVDLYGALENGHRPKLTYWLTGRPGVNPENLLELGPKIDWVIVGGESGRGARPMHPDWARTLRDQCDAAAVAFHFKQFGEWAPDRGHGESSVKPSVFLLPDGTGTVWAHRAEAEELVRVGKHAAGRELDGRTWDQYPTARNLQEVQG